MTTEERKAMFDAMDTRLVEEGISIWTRAAFFAHMAAWPDESVITASNLFWECRGGC